MISIDTIFTKAAKAVFLFFIFLQAFSGFAQKAGCTDTAANNYDPSATVNDGSCKYDITNYTPLLVDSISDRLKESSGLIWADNSLWSFNDAGNPPDIYRIDTAGNTVLQTVRLAGTFNVDWEEATFDGTYFYIGDFGNNKDGARTNLKIYKFPLSAIKNYTTNPKDTVAASQIEIINFTYSDQPANPDTVALNTTRFDCEAMITDQGKIHLFTKDWVHFTTTHYVIDSTLAGSYVANPADTLETGYLVTAAAKSPGQNVVVLFGYQITFFGTPANHFMHILSNYSGGKYFNGNKRKINLPDATYMGQAEGIAFRNETYGYISNENLFSINQALHSFDISSFAPATILATELTNFGVGKINGSDKIVWSFSAPVRSLQVQQSTDGLHFTVLNTYNHSSAGSLLSNPAVSIVYYRLAWQNDNSASQYSKVIRIENKDNKLITNFVLRAAGELSFIVKGNQSEKVTFRLLTTDGKLLSQLPANFYAPGVNKVYFLNASSLTGVALLSVADNKQKITLLLNVVK